jgi:glutathione S-transferase
MLKIYGMPLSPPSNKVVYTANYLNIPYEFHSMNIAAGETHKPEFLKINPVGKVPAIDDGGFTLFESNAIIRYLADKEGSALYPKELQTRAVVEQWLDFAAQHVALATSKIMTNTHLYKLMNMPLDERSLQDGRKFIHQYLPIVDKQLNAQAFIASENTTLADIALLSALDTCEVIDVDLSPYHYLSEWRKKLISQPFYQKCHTSYADSFNKLLGNR